MSCSPPQHSHKQIQELPSLHIIKLSLIRRVLLLFQASVLLPPQRYLAIVKGKSFPRPAYTSCDYPVLLLCISGDRSSKAAVHDMSCHEKAAGFYECMMSTSAASCVLGQKNEAHFRSRIQCVNPAHQRYRVVYVWLVRQIPV